MPYDLINPTMQPIDILMMAASGPVSILVHSRDEAKMIKSVLMNTLRSKNLRIHQPELLRAIEGNITLLVREEEGRLYVHVGPRNFHLAGIIGQAEIDLKELNDFFSPESDQKLYEKSEATRKRKEKYEATMAHMGFSDNKKLIEEMKGKDLMEIQKEIDNSNGETKK